MTDTRTMRLVKFVATAGVASRRASEEMIRAGRVTVNGQRVTDPAREVTERDEVTVDGERVSQPTRRVMYALNKPVGVVSTARDPQGRPTVVGLVPDTGRLYPVGRLDADSSGLILLTNDGELAHRLTHPSFEVPKTYLAAVAGRRWASAPCASSGPGSSLRTGAPLRPACGGLARTAWRSRSTKAATARCAGCARRWVIRCGRWSAWPLER